MSNSSSDESDGDLNDSQTDHESVKHGNSSGVGNDNNLNGKDPSPWYTDSKFQRYWNHYTFVNTWFRRHQEFLTSVHRNTVSSNDYATWCASQVSYHAQMAAIWQRQAQTLPNFPPDFYRQFPDHLRPPGEQSSSDGRRESRKKNPTAKRRRNRSHRKKRSASRRMHRANLELHLDNLDPTLGDLDISIDSAESLEFEITGEMLEFFSRSAQHRKERDSKKTEDLTTSEVHTEYVELSQASAGKNKASVLPPSERPGVRRIAEMRELYGPGAAMIQGMETAMQLNYDRNCDRKQPALWPAIPLNIRFN